MFYFGRIISAFFNQLFRFLFWNKFGQKILIAIIIGLIAFWCLGMTKVHAVEEVQDVNYDVYNYYDSIVNDAILRLEKIRKVSPNAAFFERIKNSNFDYYFYYGSNDGSSYNNAKPLKNNNLYIFYIDRQYINNLSFNATSNDYNGISGFTIYSLAFPSNASIIYFNNNATSISYITSVSTMYLVPDLLTYKSDNWTTYIQALNNNDTSTIIQLLEDIKAEQEATNDFLSEEIDETGISVEAPQVTDTASENMSNNLHTQINTLTTQLQSTVNNYYEGWDAYVWTIPLPEYIGGNISFDSGVTRRIIGSNGVVFNVIQAIWVILFGGYIVGFIKRMLDWVQTGKIFDEGGLADFIWWMDTNNEIIKASMM